MPNGASREALLPELLRDFFARTAFEGSTLLDAPISPTFVWTPGPCLSPVSSAQYPMQAQAQLVVSTRPSYLSRFVTAGLFIRNGHTKINLPQN